MTYQTGYYKYDIRPFTNYLHYLKGFNPPASYLPSGVPLKSYDPEFEKKINEWLATSGNNILYIYGGRDTWTACAVNITYAVNAKKFVIPGANHSFARIRHMPGSMQREFGEALEAMTGLKPDFSALTTMK
jgi:hypothetical protein